MKQEKYEDFTVYNLNDKNIFIHIDINNEVFYEKLFKYFFDESRILGYIENKSQTMFEPTLRNYVSMYKTLVAFIDDENLNINIDDLKKELSEYIDWEKYSDDEILKLRRDKIGKVGEYIFHNILNEYFKFSCILPKLRLITNKNMSIYGIDVIFWQIEQQMLLFGESKVSKNIDSGVKLINESLKNYEKQIFGEFMTTLSYHLNELNLPNEIKECIGTSISFEKFIEKAEIRRIGIPIFIMSGENTNVEEIFQKLNNIKKIKIRNLDVIYYIINIPIVDKNIFQSKIIEFLRIRCDDYESICK